MSPGEENEESLHYFYMNNGVDIEGILSEGLVRGETYTLSAENITVEYDDDPINLADKSVKFVYGMTKPQPTIPVMRDSLLEPPSSLQFLSGRMPEELTPPDGYMMGDVPAIEYGESFLTDIKERWVVQLSTSEQFTTDSIVRAYSGLLEMDQEMLDGLVIFDEGIYKNVSVDIDTSGLEIDTYYWRVFYMKDPDIEKSPDELKSISESEFYHPSSTFSFVLYQEEKEEVVAVENEESEGDCNEQCYKTETNYTIAAEAVTARGQMENIDVIKAGNFNISITEISFSGDEASGNGFATLNLYGIELPIRVAFSEIKINAQSQLIDGIIKAEKDQLEISDVIDNINLEGVNPNEFLSDEQAEMINNALENYRQISALAMGDPVGMPVGINQTINGAELLLALTNVSFEPREAYCQILVNIPFQFYDEIRYISMGASRICLTTGGFGPEATVHMVKSFTFDIGDFEDPLSYSEEDLERFSVSLLGPEDLDNMENIQATKMSFDCNGIKDLGIRGRVQFPTNLIVKENEDGSRNYTERAAGTFYFSLGRDREFEEGETDTGSEGEEESVSSQGTDDEKTLHIVAEIESMDQFQIPGLNDWSVGVERAYIDFSQLENAISFDDALPEDYGHEAFSESGEDEAWQGFWMKECTVKLPDFLNEGGERIQFQVSNMIIDDQYFTSNFNVQPAAEGSIEEWRISLDSVWVQITESEFEDGGIKGEMQMPLIPQPMEYRAILDYNTDDPEDRTLAYSFAVSPSSTVDIPLFMGQADLTRETYVKIGYQHNLDQESEDDQGEVLIEAALVGGLSLSTEFVQETDVLAALPFDLSLMRLPFMVKYSTVDGIDGYFGFSDDGQQALLAGINEISGEFQQVADDVEVLNSFFDGSLQPGGQGEMVGFSFGLKEMAVEGTDIENLRLIFHPFVNIIGGDYGFGGEARLTFVGGMKSDGSIGLVSPYIEGASVEIDATFSGIGVKGGICFYNLPDDKGLKGYLTVNTPIIKIEAKTQFGVQIDEEGPFPYFFLQFIGKIASGIDVGNYTPIGSIGVSFYGLGMGIYLNMGYQSPALADVNAEVDASPTSGAPAGTGPVEDPGKSDPCSFDFPGVFVERGNFRLEGILVVGLTTNPTPFNMDAKFGINLDLDASAFSVSIDLETKGYFMADVMGERESMSPAWFIGAMQLGIKFSANPSSDFPDVDLWFNAGLNVYVQVPPPGYGLPVLIKGDSREASPFPNLAARAQIMISTDRGIYFHIGSPEEPAVVAMTLGDIFDVRGELYMMMGEGVPTSLPPLPDPIPELLGNISESDEATMADANLATSSARQRTGPSVNYMPGGTGVGFAYGEKYSIDIGIESSILTATLDAVVGFDANLSEFNDECKGKLMGAAGWYAMGQAFAGVQGELSITDVLFGSGQVIPILDLGAVLVVTAGSPNPTYLDGTAGVYLDVFGGMIKGRKNFSLSVGEVCIPASINDPFSAGNFIAYSNPSDGRDDVNPFVNAEVGFHLEMNKSFDFRKTNDDGSMGAEITLTPYLSEFYLKQGNTTIDCDPSWNYNRTVCKCNNELLMAYTTYEIHAKMKVQGDSYEESLVSTFTTGAMPDNIPRDEIFSSSPLDRQRYYMKDEMTPYIQFKRDVRAFFPLGQTMQLEGGAPIHANKYYLSISEVDGPEVQRFNINEKLNQPSLTRIFLNVEQWNVQPNRIYRVSLIKKESSGLVTALSQVAISDFNNLSTTYVNGLRDSISINSQLDEEGGSNLQAGEKEIFYWHFKTSEFNKLEDKINAGAGVFENGYFYVEVTEPFDQYDIYGTTELDPIVKVNHRYNATPYDGIKSDYLSAIIDLRSEVNKSAWDEISGSSTSKSSQFSNSTYKLEDASSVRLRMKLSSNHVSYYEAINLVEDKNEFRSNDYLNYFTSSLGRNMTLDPQGTTVSSRLSDPECGMSAGVNSQFYTGTSPGGMISMVSNGLASTVYRYRINTSPRMWVEYALDNIMQSAESFVYQSPYHSKYTLGKVVKKGLEDENETLFSNLESQINKYYNEVGYSSDQAMTTLTSYFANKTFKFKWRYRHSQGHTIRNGTSNLTTEILYNSPITYQPIMMYQW